MKRFSQRYGFEHEPEQPIIDAAPPRIRYFLLRVLNEKFDWPTANGIIGKILCERHLFNGTGLLFSRKP
jgi:hypothetical protein